MRNIFESLFRPQWQRDILYARETTPSLPPDPIETARVREQNAIEKLKVAETLQFIVDTANNQGEQAPRKKKQDINLYQRLVEHARSDSGNFRLKRDEHAFVIVDDDANPALLVAIKSVSNFRGEFYDKLIFIRRVSDVQQEYLGFAEKHLEHIGRDSTHKDAHQRFAQAVTHFIMDDEAYTFSGRLRLPLEREPDGAIKGEDSVTKGLGTRRYNVSNLDAFLPYFVQDPTEAVGIDARDGTVYNEKAMSE